MKNCQTIGDLLIENRWRSIAMLNYQRVCCSSWAEFLHLTAILGSLYTDRPTDEGLGESPDVSRKRLELNAKFLSIFNSDWRQPKLVHHCSLFAAVGPVQEVIASWQVTCLWRLFWHQSHQSRRSTDGFVAQGRPNGFCFSSHKMTAH